MPDVLSSRSKTTPRSKRGSRFDPGCSVDGCGGKHEARGWCAKHYFRWKRHGDPLAIMRAEEGHAWHVGSNGYAKTARPGHPLAAGPKHYVYVHRLVLFDAIGPGEHDCHWCGVSVAWSSGTIRWETDLVVDHLDGDKLNNDRSNLVSSCARCNIARPSA